MTNKSKKEIEQEKAERRQNNQEAYEKYVERIEARQKAGETIEIKPFEKWIRKAKRIINNEEVEIEVTGDTGETKSEKFRRLGSTRMTKALEALDLIMNLSSPQYEADENDVVKMVNALRLKVLDIENSFKSQAKEEAKFSF